MTGEGGVGHLGVRAGHEGSDTCFCDLCDQLELCMRRGTGLTKIFDRERGPTTRLPRRSSVGRQVRGRGTIGCERHVCSTAVSGALRSLRREGADVLRRSTVLPSQVGVHECRKLLRPLYIPTVRAIAAGTAVISFAVPALCVSRMTMVEMRTYRRASKRPLQSSSSPPTWLARMPSSPGGMGKMSGLYSQPASVSTSISAASSRPL